MGSGLKYIKDFTIKFYLCNNIKDVLSSGACRKDASGLPDGNCVFYATQDSTVTSSLMALPYLTKNVNFCDDLTGKSINDYIFSNIYFEYDIKC